MRSGGVIATLEWGRWTTLTYLGGTTLAVDISGWMYTAMCVDTSWYGSAGSWGACVRWVMARAEMLTASGVHVLPAFDGMALPGKGSEAECRNAMRLEAAQQLEEHLRSSTDCPLSDPTARKLPRRTAAFTNLLLCEMTEKGFKPIVAPYEGDAQCSYLCNTDQADGCVTGDADLLVFGTKLVVFDYTGRRLHTDRAYSVRLSDVVARRSPGVNIGTSSGSDSDYDGDADDSEGEARSTRAQVADVISEHGAHGYQLVVALAGCDYDRDGVRGIGLATAAEWVIKEGPDPTKLAKRASLHLRSYVAGKFSETARDVEARLERTLDCFRHQVVWCPETRKRVCSCGCAADVGRHRGEVDADRAADLATGAVSSIDGGDVQIPKTKYTPNVGCGRPRYVPLPALAAVQSLPPPGSEPGTHTAAQELAVSSVIRALGEGHNAHAMAPAQRLELAHKLARLRAEYANASAMQGVDFRLALPDIGTFPPLPADLEDAEFEDMADWLRRFQSIHLDSTLKDNARGRAAHRDLITDIRKCMDQRGFVPRLEMDAYALSDSGKTKPGSAFWGAVRDSIDEGVGLVPGADAREHVGPGAVAAVLPRFEHPSSPTCPTHPIFPTHLSPTHLSRPTHPPLAPDA